MYRSLILLDIQVIVYLNDNGMNYTGSTHNCCMLDFPHSPDARMYNSTCSYNSITSNHYDIREETTGRSQMKVRYYNYFVR